MTTGNLRDRIFEAAEDLYLREGPEALSMRRVAEAVGVSAPAIYRYFENKEELLNEIVMHGLKILESYMEPALAADTPFEVLTRVIEQYLEFGLAQPRYFDFAFLAPSRDISIAGDNVTQHNWSTFKQVRDTVAACIEEGTLREGSPMEVAITIWGEVHGLMILWRTGRLGPDEALFRKTYHNCVQRMFAGLKA